MALLPAGFALPPLPYLAALVAALAGVGYGLRSRAPAVGEGEVLALAPWMVVGSVLHVLYVVEALPAAVRPLAGTPAVYATVAAVAGACWLAADTAGVDVPRVLGGAGLVVLAPLLAAALASASGLTLLWPGLGLLVAVLLAAVAWLVLRQVRPDVRATGRVGALALFAHALDGVSTAVGVDVLGFGERTPLSRVLIEFAAGLPTAPLLGSGWLFVLVKLVVAAVLVVALADYVRDEPREGRLVLGLVAAVGLGPGAHNLILFVVA